MHVLTARVQMSLVAPSTLTALACVATYGIPVTEQFNGAPSAVSPFFQ